MGVGLGAAALEWEMRKQDEKERTAREIQAVATMSNIKALEEADPNSGMTPNPTVVDTASLVDADGNRNTVPVSTPKGGNFIYDEDHNLGKGYYNPYTKKYGNKAWRNNNPGNITGMSHKLLRGAHRIAINKHGDGGDQAQQVYGTPKEGWKAMYGLMKDKYGQGSFEKEFSRWQNIKVKSGANAWKQIKNEMGHRGVSISKSFNNMTVEEKLITMNIRAQHEGWTGPKFNDPSIFL